MKTRFIPHICLSLSAMIISLQPFAQKKDSKNQAVTEVSYNINSKNPSSSMLNNGKLNRTANIPYNGKVFNQFNKMFFDATHVTWSFGPNSTYHAYFRKNGDFNSILFNKNGKIIYQINYLSQKQLPLEVRNLITDNYDEYKITNVTKVLQDNRTIWIVTLTGINHIVTVREEDGEMQQIDKIEKAN